MRPASARLTYAAAHHEHVDHAAIVHVAVIPVIHCSTDDDHRLAMRFISVFRKLAGNGDDLIARHAGNFFLPSGGIRLIVVVVFGRVFPSEAACHTVICNLKIEYGGNQCITLIAVISEHDAANGNRPNCDITSCIVLKVAVLNTTKIWETHLSFFDGGLVTFHHRQLQLDVAAVPCFF